MQWKFRAVRTLHGNVISDWLGSDTKLRARMSSYLGRLKVMRVPWPYPYYNPLGGGVGEIRFDLRNVEHRLYGCFGPNPGEFTVLIASSDKKKQTLLIQEAKKLKKCFDQNRLETEEYLV